MWSSHSPSGDSIRAHRFKGSIPQERPLAPTSVTNCKSRFSELLTYQFPSLSSINLLERLTELRETLYLEEPQFIMKGCNSGPVDGIDAQGEAWGRDVELLQPLNAPLSQISTCLPTQKLSEPCPFGLLWRLHHTGMID